MKHHDDVTLFFLVILLRSRLYRVESSVFDIALHIMSKIAIIRYTRMRIKSFLPNVASKGTYFPLAKARPSFQQPCTGILLFLSNLLTVTSMKRLKWWTIALFLWPLLQCALMNNSPYMHGAFHNIFLMGLPMIVEVRRVSEK